ncbi:MAG: hypothetical protein JXQ87_15700 [Bacteroidia bacterium]
MIRLIPTLLTALTLITCATTTKAQLIKSYHDHHLSIGIDVARPLAAIGMNQREFSAYLHWHAVKTLGISINFGMEALPNQLLIRNVSGASQSQYLTLGADLKIIEQFWVSAYVIGAQVNETYTATLAGTNFYPVTRTHEDQFRTTGVAGRMTYFEVLTEKIEMQVFIDAGLMGDLDSQAGYSRSTPGFIIGAGRAIYMGAGINVGYRLFEKKPNMNN